MEQENYSIVFSSSTGNTKKLADAVYEILPKISVIILGRMIQRSLHPICCISDFGLTKGARIPRH